MPHSLRFVIDKIARLSRVKSRKLTPIVMIATLYGCASFEFPFLQSSQQHKENEQEAAVYYTGVEGLKLLSHPDPASNVIARLPLHQKVLRSKLDRGYAYVTVTKDGLTGWVDNAKLIWKLPATSSSIPIEKDVPDASRQSPVEKESQQSIQPPVQSQPKTTDAEADPLPGTTPPSTFNPF